MHLCCWGLHRKEAGVYSAQLQELYACQIRCWIRDDGVECMLTAAGGWIIPNALWLYVFYNNQESCLTFLVAMKACSALGDWDVSPEDVGDVMMVREPVERSYVVDGALQYLASSMFSALQSLVKNSQL